jgi:hypothetical protein
MVTQKPSVQDIFRHIFLSNYQWQKSDIWSQASYRYAILWVVFLDLSDSYFLFADLLKKNDNKNMDSTIAGSNSVLT